MALDLAMVFASDPGCAPAFASSTGSTNGSAKAGEIEIESTLAGNWYCFR